MIIQVLYFGELRERLSTAREALELLRSGITVEELIDVLAARGDIWREMLVSSEPLRVAVNQEMATAQTTLSEGAEVALFRPVTGG